MRIIARFVAVLGATAALAVTAFIPAASAATTQPGSRASQAVSPKDIYDCDVYPESETSADAYCSGTPTTMFRVAIICSSGIQRYGEWKYAGMGITSYTSCPTNTFYVDGFVQTTPA